MSITVTVVLDNVTACESDSMAKDIMSLEKQGAHTSPQDRPSLAAHWLTPCVWKMAALGQDS
jgi:hypothetical protein